ncbi:MAG: histidine phosphatase family protein [Balneolaceae bacterium]|nr:histidine phosphatase family protein [Balneolaceae bacterium]
MKHILLLRHAKSSHEDSSLDDFDRPLANRGLKDAPMMGTFVKNTGYVPDLIISSPAKRAMQTAELFADASGTGKADIKWNEDFYYGSSYDYLEEIQQCAEGLDCIMLVGHNPKMEETVSLLCSDQRSYIARMPTAALVCFEHPAVQWEQVKEGTARIKWMMIPRLLKNN